MDNRSSNILARSAKNTNDSSTDRLFALDAMRGIAAICVMAHHVGLLSGLRLAGHGFVAVDFFFMLSGFVVSRAYEKSFNGPTESLRFLIRRVERLYPTILVGLLLGAAALATRASTHPDGGLDLVLQFLLVPILSGGALFPLDLPIWSIFFELCANILHANINRSLSKPVLVGIVAISGSIFFGLMITHPATGAAWGFNGGLSFLGGFARVTFGYFAGVLIYRCFGKGRPFKFRVPFAVLAAALIFLLAGPSIGPRPTIDIVAIFFAFPLLIIFGLDAEIGSRSINFWTWLGSISFPLYAIHMPILEMARPYMAGYVAWGAVMLVILGLAAIVEHGVDEPIRRHIKQIRIRRSNFISR